MQLRDTGGLWRSERYIVIHIIDATVLAACASFLKACGHVARLMTEINPKLMEISHSRSHSMWRTSTDFRSVIPHAPCQSLELISKFWLAAAFPFQSGPVYRQGEVMISCLKVKPLRRRKLEHLNRYMSKPVLSVIYTFTSSNCP